MKQFLNFHTHHIPPGEDEKCIYNLSIRDIEHFDILNQPWLSLGIHPWYADAKHWKTQLEAVVQRAAHKNVLAIGECGLDRLIAFPMEQQLLIFDAQVQLATQLRKPVIIHCVRAFNELIAWKKRRKPAVPLIIHGFNNKPEIAQQLLKHGFYFSFGVALLKEDSNAAEVIKMIPVERLFIENDDQLVSIQLICEAAANLLKMSLVELTEQIWANFAAIFKEGVFSLTHY